MNKVFSPTQTEKWLQCPRLWSLSKEWRPKLATNKDVGALLGQGFAAGMAHWYGQLKRDGDSIQAGQVGKEAVQTGLAELDQLGIAGATHEIHELLVSLPEITKASIIRYIAQDPIPADWTILDTELEMFEERSRLDLGLRDGAGPAVLDFKTSRKLEARYRQARVDSYRLSHQQLHYLWRYSQFLGEPVRRYYIVLVSLQPRFEATLHQFDVPEKTFKFWLRSAYTHWVRMEDDLGWLPEVPGNFNSCTTKFGPCEMWAACHDYHHDPDLMAVEYVKKPLREERK